MGVIDQAQNKGTFLEFYRRNLTLLSPEPIPTNLNERILFVVGREDRRCLRGTLHLTYYGYMSYGGHG